MESLVLPSTSELSTLRVLESLDRLLGEVELLQRSQRDSGRRQTETIAACHAIGTDVRRLARLEEKGHAATRELLGRVAETGGQVRVARAHLLLQGHSLCAVAQHARLLGQRKAPRILVVKVGANTPPQAARTAPGVAIGGGSDRCSVRNEHVDLNGAAWLSRHERPAPGAPGPPRGPPSESYTLDERTMHPAALAVGESARPSPVRGAGRVRRLDSISEEERADVGTSPSGAATKRESGDPGLAAREPSVNWAVGEEEERSMGMAATAVMSGGGASVPPDSPRGGAMVTIGTTGLSRFSEDIARAVTEQGTAVAHSLLNARCPPATAATEYSHGGNKAGGHDGVDDGISRAGGVMEEEVTEVVVERARPPEKSAGPRGTRSKRRRRTAPPATAAEPPTSPAGFRIAQMAPCVCAEAELHLKAGHEIASACEEISRAMERCSRPTAPAASTPPGDDRPPPLEMPRWQGRGLGEVEAAPEDKATVPGCEWEPGEIADRSRSLAGRGRRWCRGGPCLGERFGRRREFARARRRLEGADERGAR
ncbi:uncharacterized protein LOC133358227 [Lethenteron reissneri]|uniref:uncharacterized protein LOC133358227 n=1 Tax=Lethenteron reissneri TaxID=7753 RepID=UPI002AB7D8DE|nr:uncharacterized protein LOC133358227 [Lethenteron reissneri]XP_061432454.1 uncharacterized protein LOC133358227 [Lethenteron reissneri]XP_061432455.1 uncharacterized protein LOC133358227 [Lethenteron reissneri]XP_061432456.1 uncharacterized protein LOC133358227 [Lethenteron reissneri]